MSAQTASASANSKAVSLLHAPPQESVKGVAAETETKGEVSQPTLLPEIFLLIMKRLAADKSLRTLLNFALANKTCSALALPFVRTYGRTVWLAVEDCNPYDEEENWGLDVGDIVLGAFTNKEAANRCLVQVLGWDDLDFEDEEEENDLTTRDFEKEPYYEEHGKEGGATYTIEKHLLLGTLKPEGHVWILYFIDDPEYYSETRLCFKGMFTSKQAARKAIKKKYWVEDSESDLDEYKDNRLYDGYSPVYRFKRLELVDE